MTLYKYTGHKYENGTYMNVQLLNFSKSYYDVLNSFINSQSDYKYMLLSMMVNSKKKNLKDIVKLFHYLKNGIIEFPSNVWNTLKTNSKINENTFIEYVSFISKYNKTRKTLYANNQ